MTATKRKLLYSLVALFFLLVLALVGWLVHVLFAFPVVQPKPAPAPVVPALQRQAGEGAFSETVINIDALPEAATGTAVQADAVADEAVATATDGHIPCICEGYGPEIASREASQNPLTHQTVFTATRAVVTLTLPPQLPRGDQ